MAQFGSGSRILFLSQLESLNGEFMSSILHLLPLISPIFTYVDSYLEYGPVSTKVLNTDPNCIRIQNTALDS